MTAAHCVRQRLFVRLGEHDLRLRDHGEMEMRVTEAVVHPLYDSDTVINDVAMLRYYYTFISILLYKSVVSFFIVA